MAWNKEWNLPGHGLHNRPWRGFEMGWLEVDVKLTWRGHILRDKKFKQCHMAWNKGRNLSGPGLT